MSITASVVTIRPGQAADAAAATDVFSQSWRHAYRGIIPHLALEGMVRNRGHEWWLRAIKARDRTLVLEVAGKVGGYVTCGAARGRGNVQGEIYELYLAPTYQGLGLGELLFEAARSALDARGLRGLVVWALVDNTPACNFYWRRGGRPVSSRLEKVGGTKLEKVAFVWP